MPCAAVAPAPAPIPPVPSRSARGDRREDSSAGEVTKIRLQQPVENRRMPDVIWPLARLVGALVHIPQRPRWICVSAEFSRLRRRMLLRRPAARYSPLEGATRQSRRWLKRPGPLRSGFRAWGGCPAEGPESQPEPRSDSGANLWSPGGFAVDGAAPTRAALPG